MAGWDKLKQLLSKGSTPEERDMEAAQGEYSPIGVTKKLLDDGPMPKPWQPGMTAEDDAMRSSFDPMDFLPVPGEKAALLASKIGGLASKGGGLALPMVAGMLKGKSKQEAAKAIEEMTMKNMSSRVDKVDMLPVEFLKKFKGNETSGLNVDKVREAIQKNSEEADRLARAKELGFDTSKTYYHGTKGPVFDKFSTERVFVTPDPDFAGNYSGYINNEPNARIMPMYANTKNAFDFENPEHLERFKSSLDKALKDQPLTLAEDGAIYSHYPPKDLKHSDRINNIIKYLSNKENSNWLMMENKNFINALKEAGFDSSFINEAGRKNLMTLNPDNLRSKFDKFDNLKKLINPELQMDEASRMARAKEMGFNTDKTYYHGTTTPEDFTEFKKPAEDNMNQFGSGVYMTENPEKASGYSKALWDDEPEIGSSRKPERSRVLPLHVRGKLYKDDLSDFNNFQNLIEHLGFKDRSEMEKALHAKYGDIPSEDKINRALKDMGYTGRDILGYNGQPREVVVFDPKDVRSKFAKFDPDKSGSGNISAGLAGAGLLGASQLKEEDDEEKFKNLLKLMSSE